MNHLLSSFEKPIQVWLEQNRRYSVSCHDFVYVYFEFPPLHFINSRKRSKVCSFSLVNLQSILIFKCVGCIYNLQIANSIFWIIPLTSIFMMQPAGQPESKNVCDGEWLTEDTHLTQLTCLMTCRIERRQQRDVDKETSVLFFNCSPLPYGKACFSVHICFQFICVQWKELFLTGRDAGAQPDLLISW